MRNLKLNSDMILDKIIAHKKIEVERAKLSLPLREIIARAADSPPTLDFQAALQSPDGAAKVIAEIKRASPSKGIIREDFDPVRIARSYAAAGASAISVLTDEEFFGGRLEYLRAVREAVRAPLLRKDFTVDAYQIYEGRLFGADAILLIASALETSQIAEFIDIAESLGMSAIVEVHNEAELEKALSAPSRIIGINNRDLKTFSVSLDVSARLRKLIPESKLVIAESGIRSAGDIEALKNAGIWAFLIGETFMRAEDPGAALSDLLRQSL
ncbi:MAG: indole-3-glycerol phosphate synthase TrpC [Deltaproteobacteria bacterium]